MMLTPLQISQTLHAPSAAVLANWPHIEMQLAELEGYSERVQVAAAATIRVECPGFAPIREYGNDLRFMRLYWENQHVRKMLGNVTPQDAAKYCGRGFIQITGLDNYHRCGVAIGVDLVANPDLALQPDIAAKVFVWFFRHCFEAANLEDWTKVRHIVNGGVNGLDAFLGYVKALTKVATTSKGAHA